MSEFPLYDIFHRLRQADFPLGLDEYHLALRALQGGFGLSDSEALRRLCHTLWVKAGESSAQSRRFNAIFDQTLREWQKSSAPAKPTPQNAEQPLNMDSTEEPPPPSEAPSNLHDKSDTTPTTTLHDEDETKSPEPGPIVPFVQPRAETKTIQAFFANQNHKLLERSFDFSGNDLPISQRQMQQSWRKLRYPIREGPPRELDIEATVRRIAEDGFLLEPVLIPRRINRAELLLLLDQGGSMVPFHPFAKRLRDSAVRGGQLGQVKIFYFHNCPINYLYHDRARLHPEKIDDVLAEVNAEQTGILIFSDGGAARGGYYEDRIERTQKFIHRLRAHVQHIAWLNPMPKERWRGTTAGSIAHFVPMFAMNWPGMDNAIDALRGRER